ncbi:MAG: 4Fe-4S binding protein, partial [Gammaproteobacteria bacterium]
MLRELLGQSDDESGLPLIKGKRCVHALVEKAGCRACVDVCPKNAWQIDDASVALDTSLCDGCGLCAPVCTEGAISHEYRMEDYSYQEEPVAFAVCENAEVECDSGRIPCLHSLGLQELLKLHRQGIYILIVSAGDCNQCQRGRVERLSNRISSLNGMLLQRGKKTFNCKIVSPSIFSELIKHFSPPESKKMSRRNFFRTGAGGLLEIKYEVAGKENTDHLPPGNLLPKEQASDMSIFSPRLNQGQCVGCDTCIKICPHNALQIAHENSESYYQIEDDNC